MRRWTSALCATTILAATAFMAGCGDSGAPAGKSSVPITDPAAGDPANVQAPSAGGAAGGPGAGAVQDDIGSGAGSTTPQ